MSKFIMTNKALVREYQKTHARIDKLYSQLAETEYRDMTPSQMRELPEKPHKVKVLLKHFDLAYELRSEAERRYGPGLVVVDQLIWRSV